MPDSISFLAKRPWEMGLAPIAYAMFGGYHLRVDPYGYLQKKYDLESHDQPKHIASSINLVRHSHRDHIGVVGTILGLCQASACLMNLSGAQPLGLRSSQRHLEAVSNTALAQQSNLGS